MIDTEYHKPAPENYLQRVKRTLDLRKLKQPEPVEDKTPEHLYIIVSGDNLSGKIKPDLKEIKRGSRYTPNRDIYLLIDKENELGSHRVHIRNGAVVASESIPEVSFNCTTPIEEFLVWSTPHLAPESIPLGTTLWGHGYWGSFLYDSDAKPVRRKRGQTEKLIPTSIAIKDIARILSTNRLTDFLALDCCYGIDLATLCTLGKAGIKYVAGTPVAMPDTGQDYTEFLKNTQGIRNPHRFAIEYVMAIPQEYLTSRDNQLSFYNYSAFDASQSPPIATALEDIIDKATDDQLRDLLLSPDPAFYRDDDNIDLVAFESIASPQHRRALRHSIENARIYRRDRYNRTGITVTLPQINYGSEFVKTMEHVHTMPASWNHQLRRLQSLMPQV